MAILETDPLDLLLDPDGDLDLSTGDLRFVSGAAGVAQRIKTALQLYKGEWFANLDAGVPWYQDILAQRFDEARIRTPIRRAILGVAGVKSIEKLELSFSAATRELTITFAVETDFGDTVADTLNQAV